MPLEPSHNKNTNISVFFIFKLIIGIALIIFLFLWQGNGEKVLNLFQNIKAEFLIILLVMVFLLNLVSCLKWQLFLREYGIHVGIIRLISLYCMGKFFNNFFPSTVGGDLARSYILGRQIQSFGKSLVSVLLERFTGFIALSIIAVLFALINTQILKEPLVSTSLIFSIAIGCVTTITIFFPKRALKFLIFFKSFLIFDKVFSRFKAILTEIDDLNRKKALFLSSMGYSFIFHLMTIIQVYIACLTIGFYPNILDIAVITPIILMISSIPLSPNKIGIWEWAFGLFFIKAGGEMAEGVAVALVIRGLGLLVSAIGGCLLLVEKMNKEEKFLEK